MQAPPPSALHPELLFLLWCLERLSFPLGGILGACSSAASLTSSTCAVCLSRRGHTFGVSPAWLVFSEVHDPAMHLTQKGGVFPKLTLQARVPLGRHPTNLERIFADLSLLVDFLHQASLTIFLLLVMVILFFGGVFGQCSPGGGPCCPPPHLEAGSLAFLFL